MRRISLAFGLCLALWSTAGLAAPLVLDQVGVQVPLPDGWRARAVSPTLVVAHGAGVELRFHQNDAAARPPEAELSQAAPTQVGPYPARRLAAAAVIDGTALTRVRLVLGDAQRSLVIEARLPQPNTPEQLATLDRILAGTRAPPPTTAEGWYVLIETLRARTLDQLGDQLVEKGADRFGYVITGLLMVAALGVLLLLAPLYWRRRHPGRTGAVVGYSSLSAGLFTLTILGLTLSVALLQLMQLVVGQIANPKLRIVDAGFDVMTHNLDTLMQIGPLMLDGPTQLVQSGQAPGMIEALLMNARQFKSDFGAFDGLLGIFEHLSGLSAWLPVILSGLVIVLLLVSIRGTLVDIVRLPDRILSGEATVGGLLAPIGRRIGGELLVTIIVMVLLAGVTLGSTWLMSKSVPPLLEALMGYLMINVMYVLAETQASTGMVYLSVGAVLLYFVASFAVLVAAGGLLVSKVHKALRARLVDGVPIRAQQGVLWRGPILAAWLLVLPWLYVLAAEEIVDRLLEVPEGSAVDWTWMQLSGPVVMVVGFGLFFIAGQGLWAFTRLKGYPITERRR